MLHKKKCVVWYLFNINLHMCCYTTHKKNEEEEGDDDDKMWSDKIIAHIYI